MNLLLEAEYEFATHLLSAVRHLQEEVHQIEEQAKMEAEDSQTYALGLLRKDLVEECRRRLMGISYMVKDAREHRDSESRPAY
jgi:Mg2+ and Co2+ transporter CorA